MEQAPLYKTMYCIEFFNVSKFGVDHQIVYKLWDDMLEFITSNRQQIHEIIRRDLNGTN